MSEALVARIRYHIKKANFVGLKDAESTLLLGEAADAIENLSKALDAVNDAHNEGYDVGYWAGKRDYEPKWIPVTERLPNGNGEYLVSGKDKVWACEFMILGDVGGWCNNARNPCVEYWMPKPKPPKED